MFEERKEYEMKLFNAVKEFVKNKMSPEDKDRIFEIAQPSKMHYEVLRKNPNYAQKRDDFVARDLLATTLAYEVKPEAVANNKFIKEYKKSWEKEATVKRYSDNAIKGLNKFPEKVKEILAITQEEYLNPERVQYLGSNSYLYANSIFINFTNSPLSVDIRII